MASRKRKLRDPLQFHTYSLHDNIESDDSESDVSTGESDYRGASEHESSTVEGGTPSPTHVFPSSSNDAVAVDMTIDRGQVRPRDVQVTSNPSKPDLRAKPAKLLFKHADMNAVDYFFMFYPRSIFELTAKETNKYADWILGGDVPLTRASNFHRWTLTNTAEIQAFTALQIAMGLVTKPGLSQYWETEWLIGTPGFSTVMSRHRFEMLNSFLHFISDEEEVEPGEPGYDPHFRVRPIMDMSIPTFLQNFRPGSNAASTDENSVLFKGRIFLRKYIPTKAAKKYLTFRVVTDSQTGFCLSWDPHTLDDEVVAEKHSSSQCERKSAGPKSQRTTYTEFAWKFVTNSDILYQQESRYHYPSRDVKSYMIVYHFAIEVALENAYIAYKIASNNKMTVRRFRCEVINGLLLGYKRMSKQSGRPSNTSDIHPEARLTGRHFPARYERERFRPDCIVCSDRSKGERKQTRFFCKQCGVPMCLVPCFEKYHTVKHYR